MASLYNPLDEFESYSVHYVMVATRTTEDAADFVSEDRNIQNATLEAINSTSQLGDPIEYMGKKRAAFLVMDTRRFSQFSIQHLDYEVLINGLAAGNSHSNVVSKVSMTMLDAIGISFVNFLQYLVDEQMQCNFNGIVFMLRVIFVGEGKNSKTGKYGTQTVQTITLPLMLQKLELNLDFSKGIYTIEWLPYLNFDAVVDTDWLRVTTAATMFSKVGSNTLGSIVENFQQALNDKSLQFYNDVQAARGGSGHFGRLVKYMITLPGDELATGSPGRWADFELSAHAVANAKEIIFKRDAESAAANEKIKKAQNQAPETLESPKIIDTHFSFEPESKITDALDALFRSVPAIQDLGAGVHDKDVIKFYKHIIGLSSDDDTICVHVDVVEFVVPNVEVQKANAHSQATSDASQFYKPVGDDGRRIPLNYAEFDYIYTGMNKDILNFDLKIQNLQYLYQANLNVGAAALAGVSDNGQQDSKNPVDRTAELIQARAYDAILLPHSTGEELRNFSRFSKLKSTKDAKEHQKSAQDYTKNLSAFYATSPVTALITIRGNPTIMQKFNYETLLRHTNDSTVSAGGTASSVAPTVKTAYRQWLVDKIIRNNTVTSNVTTGEQTNSFRREDGTLVLQNTLGSTGYASAPVFVLINIKGPNVDFRGKPILGTNYATEVIKDNYYVVFKVANHIEGSSFTQTLELYLHNVFGLGKTTNSATTKTVKTV